MSRLKPPYNADLFRLGLGESRPAVSVRAAVTIAMRERREPGYLRETEMP